MKRGLFTGFAAIMCVCTSCAAVSAQAPAAVPALGPDIPLTLANVSQSVLPNGLRIVVVEDHRQPAIHLRLVVPAGYGQDPVGKAGMATLLADELFSSHSDAHVKIAERVVASGASFHASAQTDFLQIAVAGVSSNADDFADLIADVAEHPKFPAHGDLLQDAESLPTLLAGVLGNPGTLASVALNHVVYGASAYGNLPSGTPRSISGLTNEDFVSFYNARFTPSRAILFVSGDITDSAAHAMALKAFGDWKGNGPIPVSAPPAVARLSEPAVSAGSKPVIIILDRPGAQQTEIRIGARTTGYSDPQRVAADLATAILGGGEFENRLTQEIRVKRGLTYGVASSFHRNREAGDFTIDTYTKNASTGEVIQLVLAEVAKLAANPPTETEMADHKSYLTGSFAVRVATVNGVVEELIEAVLLGEGTDALAHYKSQVDAVTAGQVSKIIADLHIESAHIVLVGDAKIIQPQVSDIGTVTVIEPDQLDLMSPTLRKASSSD